MGSDLFIDPVEDPLKEFYLASFSNPSIWNGRQITWSDIPEVRSEIERRIIDIYDSGNPLLATQLAILYYEETHPQYEVQLVKSSTPSAADAGISQIQYLIELQNRILHEQAMILEEFGLREGAPLPPLEPISGSNYPALYAYQVYCQENGIVLSPPKMHSGRWKEFWEKHKGEIIIAAVIVVIAVTVAVVIVTTAGSGTNIAIAAGAGAAKEAIDGYNKFSDSQNFQSEFPDNEQMQHFAKTMDAADLNSKGAIPVIETSAIPEINPEVLIRLANDWNGSLRAAANEPSSPVFIGPILQLSTPEIEFPSIPIFQPIEETASLSQDLQSASLLPWVNEGTSYIRWKERYDCERLFKELEERNTSFSQPVQEGDFDKVINPARTWVEAPQESRPEFNDVVIDNLSVKRGSDTSVANNFASQAEHYFEEFVSPPPFEIVPLIGNQGQGTINYHCGIGNSFDEIVDGGTCLYETLGRELAVQPHLVHSPSVAKGLALVAAEQSDKLLSKSEELLAEIEGRLPAANFFGVVVYSSNIQKAIDYEVENLSKTAQNIIEQNRPNLKQVHVTFSNGGYVFNEALKQLPPEYRETIIVLTTGTTAIIDEGLAHKVANIIGDKDKGSQLSNGGMRGVKKAQEDGRVILIEQTETQEWINGHYFMQPDYQEAILDHLRKKILGKYEIY